MLTQILLFYDTMDLWRRRKTVSKLANTMYRLVSWDNTIERLRREVQTAEHGQNTAVWWDALNYAIAQRADAERVVASLLPSRTYQWDRPIGYKKRP